MPSPVGHLLAGAAVYLAGTNKENRSKAALGATLLGSIFPDFDFLPGILIGEPAAFHHGISHSLAFAILYGALVFFLFSRCRLQTSAARAAYLGALAYASHVLLDLVGVREGARTIPLFWPLADNKFGIDLSLFAHFHHGGLQHGLWSVLRWDNLPAITRELAILGTPVLLLSLRREWRDRSMPSRQLDRP
jgi:hypothetical protein